MVMLRYSTFLKVLALLEPDHQIVYGYIQVTRWGGVLLLYREVIGVFYRSSQLG